MQAQNKGAISQPLEENGLLSDNAKSSLVSRNITIGAHRTSVRLEPDMWTALREICRREHASMHEIATAVHARKSANTSLTAALRVFVMAYYRAAATEDGHNRAGHGPGGAFMQTLVRQRGGERADQGPLDALVVDYRLALGHRPKA